MPHPDSEQALENETIALFGSMGWATVDCMNEICGVNNPLGRETKSEVVLVPYLRSALTKLNPGLPSEAIQLAIDELVRDRSTSLENTNCEIYQLLKNGVKVRFKTDDDEEQEETLKVIDWATPTNNDFLLASQLWITGEIYTRRTDLI